MKASIRTSLRAQMLANILGAIVIIACSSAYILFSAIRIQDVVNRSFERQRYVKEINGLLGEFQQAFLDYITTKSSNALSDILVLSQRIRGMIPQYDAAPTDPVKLQEMELFSLVEGYLNLADRAIDEKRAMDVAGYTGHFAEMEDLSGFIIDEIEIMSSERFSAQLTEYESFINASRNVHLWNLLFIIFISIFSLMLVLRAVGRINRPMVSLSSAAKEISAGNFDVADVGMSSLHEIDQVVEAFNGMKRDIHTYIGELEWQRNVEKEYLRERVRNMKMEQQIRRMELYTMQAQMNPHFLFNTLNTGVQLANVEGAERTAEFMDQLSRLFRHNLREKNVVVPLRHEIEGLESYFYILRVRFSRTLDLALDCPPEILDRHSVPASLLQPLVENCVVHAFTGREGRNSILVRVFEEPGILCLSVSDNGVGIPPDRAEELLREANPEGFSGKVTGLQNVIQRLRFFFPEARDVISISGRDGGGTEILIRIETGKELCIAY
jgi:two-component system, sensor histidine kinase YesM